MKNSLILQDKNYISARRVHEVFGYASDYVGQLCRAGKLDCKMVGRSWFVTEESIINHKLLINEFLKNKNKEKSKVAKKLNKKTIAKQVEVPVEATVEKAAEPVVVQSIPLLCAPIVIPVATPFTAPIEFHPITLVPGSFALPYSISESFLLACEYPKIDKEIKKVTFVSPVKTYAGVGVFVLAFVFVAQSVLFPNFNIGSSAKTLSQNISNSYIATASVASVSSAFSSSREVFSKVVSFFTTIPHMAFEIFDSISSKVAVIEKETSAPGFNGLAVAPASGRADQDEVIKQRIRDSFSDEVKVSPDKSGTAGVITPVFKKSTSDDFLYVLVPVSPNTQ